MSVKDSSSRRDGELPTPTLACPYAQLDWIFTDKASLYSKKSTKDNYLSGLGFYKRFLRETNNFSKTLEHDPRFFINREWDVFALNKIKTWMDATNLPGSDGYISSSTATSMVSVVRLTMAHA